MKRFIAMLRSQARDGWQRVWAVPWPMRAYHAAVLVALLLGVFLRLNGQISQRSSLWFDEALWADRMLTRDLLALSIRPVGFMWTVKQIVAVFGPSEFWLRFLPNVASIAALLLIPYVASQLFASRMARLLLLALFALHPALIDYSKEFKPYAFEVFLHLVPLAIYLRYRQTGRRAYFYAFLGVLPVLFVFAYNMMFTFPGLLLLGAYVGFRERRWRGLIPVIVSGAVCLAVVGSIYWVALRGATGERTEQYWGRKYDVFYKKEVQKGQPQVDWLVEKYDDLAALPGLRRELWVAPPTFPPRLTAELGAFERLFWVLAHCLGLYFLVTRRRLEELLLLVMPTVCVIAVNMLGKWPFGAFRTNLFLCVYMLTIPMFGLEFLAGKSTRRAWTLAGVIGLLTIVPGFTLGFDWHRHKQMWTREHHGRVVIERLRSFREQQLAADPSLPPARLVLDAHTFHSHNFYLKWHPTFSPKHREFFRKNFVQDDERGRVQSIQQRLQARLRSEKQPVWVVISKSEDIENKVKDYAHRVGQVLIEERIADEHLLMLVAKKAETGAAQ